MQGSCEACKALSRCYHSPFCFRVLSAAPLSVLSQSPFVDQSVFMHRRKQRIFGQPSSEAQESRPLSQSAPKVTDAPHVDSVLGEIAIQGAVQKLLCPAPILVQRLFLQNVVELLVQDSFYQRRINRYHCCASCLSDSRALRLLLHLPLATDDGCSH